MKDKYARYQGKTILVVYFDGMAGDEQDQRCQVIFAQYGEFEGAGTYVGDGATEREVCYIVPNEKAAACTIALKEAGFAPITEDIEDYKPQPKLNA
jgi:hypothetical protein